MVKITSATNENSAYQGNIRVDRAGYLVFEKIETCPDYRTQINSETGVTEIVKNKAEEPLMKEVVDYVAKKLENAAPDLSNKVAVNSTRLINQGQAQVGEYYHVTIQNNSAPTNPYVTRLQKLYRKKIELDLQRIDQARNYSDFTKKVFGEILLHHQEVNLDDEVNSKTDNEIEARKSLSEDQEKTLESAVEKFRGFSDVDFNKEEKDEEGNDKYKYSNNNFEEFDNKLMKKITLAIIESVSNKKQLEIFGKEEDLPKIVDDNNEDNAKSCLEQLLNYQAYLDNSEIDKEWDDTDSQNLSGTINKFRIFELVAERQKLTISPEEYYICQEKLFNLLNAAVEEVEGKTFAAAGKEKIRFITLLGGRGGQYNYWGAARPHTSNLRIDVSSRSPLWDLHQKDDRINDEIPTDWAGRTFDDIVGQKREIRVLKDASLEKLLKRAKSPKTFLLQYQKQSLTDEMPTENFRVISINGKENQTKNLSFYTTFFDSSFEERLKENYLYQLTTDSEFVKDESHNGIIQGTFDSSAAPVEAVFSAEISSENKEGSSINNHHEPTENPENNAPEVSEEQEIEAILPSRPTIIPVNTSPLISSTDIDDDDDIIDFRDYDEYNDDDEEEEEESSETERDKLNNLKEQVNKEGKHLISSLITNKVTIITTDIASLSEERLGGLQRLANLAEEEQRTIARHFTEAQTALENHYRITKTKPISQSSTSRN
ncbi:9589_t:CDS:2 [Entrophospora sp. SA101]|nr:9589_t:CDS:2 [Entrophospora sp. SA101]